MFRNVGVSSFMCDTVHGLRNKGSRHTAGLLSGPEYEFVRPSGFGEVVIFHPYIEVSLSSLATDLKSNEIKVHQSEERPQPPPHPFLLAIASLDKKPTSPFIQRYKKLPVAAMAPSSNSSSNSNYSNSNAQHTRTDNSTQEKSSAGSDSRSLLSIGGQDEKNCGEGVSGLAEAFGNSRPFPGGDQQGHDSRQVRGDTRGSTGSDGTNSHGNSNSNSRVDNNGQGNNPRSNNGADKDGQRHNRKSSDEEINSDWVWSQADEAAAGASWWERK
jgi:hypothetical protein